MKRSFSLPFLLMSILVLCTSCTLHTYHFGVPNRAEMVPDFFIETEQAIANAEHSDGAKYCPDKLDKARQLAHDGAAIYWTCKHDEAVRLMAEARRLAREVEGCGPTPPAKVQKRPPVKVCMPLNINFRIDSAEILPDYDLDIAKVADFMKKNPDTVALIEGHTDNVGTEEYNLALSQRRADSVVNCLTEKYGIERSRLSAKGFGMSRPVADNSSEEGRQKNRRIEGVISCALDKNFVPPPSKLCVSLMIDFETDSAVIKPEFDPQIAEVAEFMKKYTDTTAVVEGHTDDVGGSRYNMDLSQRRAESVMNKLIEENGIERSRLSAKGYGDTRRLVYNTTPEGRKKNRRVEVWVDCVLVR
jgi:OOP family OmpA-OmpF porin